MMRGQKNIKLYGMTC